MLKISQLRSGYSAVPVLKDIDVVVEAGQFVSIVGPNGAGKSTLFKTISGTVEAMAGTIEFEGTNLLSVPPAKRPHMGIAHVPEGRQVFASLTVRENLEMGAYTQAGQDNWARNIEQIYEWFPKLKEREDQLAGTLSGGEQQMVAIGRGLASSPKLLMLDEPSMGLAPAVADFIFDRLMDIRKAAGLTILLVEQRVAEALQFADHAYVLETGQIALEGDNETLKADDRIRQAYLGM
ncbi:ABC transporter ATP-binding protein [Devosia faecipullorum]|uniref:ABC transporter ATP-binding protein n=1 Tax=Devosia faecipullorum TaxID=2755039 RepID=UPI00187B590B|nr:ABC transporter ATP-binding protein [Devosia faecipullorum]MBE7734283.1 ABC transporter ATP-binding protein [Devosia faecipullorum]